MGISGFLRRWDERMDTLLATNVASRIRGEAASTDVERDLLVAAGGGKTIADDQRSTGLNATYSPSQIGRGGGI